GTVVAVMGRRSIEMTAALLAILKTGCAYLPIDPNYPRDRIQYILNDSQARILLIHGDEAGRSVDPLPFDGHILNLQELWNTGEKEPWDTEFPPLPHVTADKPAYVLYTSGSTGKPKGVIVEHRNVIGLVKDSDYIRLKKGDRLLLTGSMAFDITTFEMWGPLLNGLTLHMVDKEVMLDAEKLGSILSRNNIDILHLIPQLFNQLASGKPEIFGVLNCFMVGGDMVNPGYVNVIRSKFPHLEILHMYGPTENTVFSTCLPVNKEYEAGIPIGKPIRFSTAYILDGYGNLQPVGAVGELCVGGTGVARGYLNNPGLTDEKFTLYSNFSVKGESPEPDRIYRTGDMARWLPDGNIEFLGRRDHQVKLKGIRIELGEIENRLLTHPRIKETTVVVKEGKTPGQQYLCAYIVQEHSTAISDTELREFLTRYLPDDMIPAYFVPLQAIPVTPNGKVDRKALPEPDGSAVEDTRPYLAPRNKVEEKLAITWNSVLGRKRIGIDENFFAIGGDSIKAVQVSSRLIKEGYKVEIKDILKHPVISQLAPLVKSLERTADQAPVTGVVPLTPVQERFFANPGKAPHYNNMAVMFHSRERIADEAFKTIFMKLKEQHDVFRMTYREENGRIIQEGHGLEDYPFSSHVFDLCGSEEAVESLERKNAQLQVSINLETGPLMLPALFHLDDGDRLIVIVHHLVIDGISWRILFEDIESLLRQYKNKEPLQLPQKSDSFKLWSQKLREYANTKSFLKEKEYWRNIEAAEVPQVPRDFDEKDNCYKDSRTLSFNLDEQETGGLLNEVPNAFSTEINDILLTALGLGIRETFGLNRVLIALEGHGREEIFEELDITGTVGWFTSIYPVLLEVSLPGALDRQIVEIKETLRRIPNNGIGYGILKYLTKEEYKAGIEFKSEPGISFNYLGQFDSDLEQISMGVAKESTGSTRSIEESRDYELDFGGMITGNKLEMSLTYNTRQFKEETVQNLMQHFKGELCRIISYCSARKEPKLTPGDLTYKGVSIEYLEHLETQYRVEDVYTLSPMQEGMLFHSVSDLDAATDFVQVSNRTYGHLDTHMIKKSLDILFKRYSILRTAFVHENLPRPLQVVLKDRTADFYYEDISGKVAPGDIDLFVKEFKEKDRERSFDLSKDVLMRISVVKTGESEYEFIWSHHHILIDGWCTEILISEYLEIYSSLMQGRPCRLPEVTQYRVYIEWLEKQERELSGNYWARLLEGYGELASLPTGKIFKAGEKIYKDENYVFEIEPHMLNRLENFSRQNQVTLNIVFQAVWGIILSKYNRTYDVVFGAVVSGRPPHLKDVESIVGIFINSIPIRIRYEENMKFSELLLRIHENAANSEPHHYYSLAEIQAASLLKHNLLDHLLVFENYPKAVQMDGEPVETEAPAENVNSELPGSESFFGYSNYDFNVLIEPEEQLRITFKYNGNIYDRQLMKMLKSHLINVFEQIVNKPDLSIYQIEIKSNLYPLSAAQRRLFDFCSPEPLGREWSLYRVMMLEGQCESRKAEEVFHKLIERHESLRTYIELMGRQPTQRMHEKIEFHMEYYEAAKEESRAIIDTFRQPIHIFQQPLFKVGMIKINHDRHLLMVNMHRMIADRLSFEILVRDFIALYEGKNLSPLKYRYRDYCGWQQAELKKETAEKQEEYWRKQFEAGIPTLELTADSKETDLPGTGADRGSFEINKDLTAGIRKLEEQSGIDTGRVGPFYITLSAIFQILLSKYFGREDIVLALPLPGRGHAGFENVIGMFGCTPAVRNRLSPDKTFDTFWTEVKTNTYDAYDNRDYPLNESLMKTASEGASRRYSFFEVAFALNDARESSKVIHESGSMLLKATPYVEAENNIPVFDLLLEAAETETRDTLSMQFIFSEKVFRKASIEKMAKRYVEILEQVLENKKRTISSITLSHDFLMLKSKEDDGDFGF
ncbi:MAG: amino acid adenylation domain-containing protein, partial [bacterium]|nr:amino acid adenylation domain-containing protein [bacterium]